MKANSHRVEVSSMTPYYKLLVLLKQRFGAWQKRCMELVYSNCGLQTKFDYLQGVTNRMGPFEEMGDIGD